jgi:TPR repeat protein
VISVSVYSRCIPVEQPAVINVRLASMLALSILLLMIVCNTVWAGFEKGLNAYEKGDYITALLEWTPLADAGDSQAQYNIGWMYKRGRGVPQSDTTAIGWLEKSAQGGHAGAQSTLGHVFYYGEGVERNEIIGAKWFTLAAKQGNLRARSELEYMTHHSVGVAYGYRSIADEVVGMFSSAFLFMFNPLAWMLVIYLSMKGKSFAKISSSAIAIQMLCVLPFAIYFLLAYQKQGYASQSDWNTGTLELGVLAFISIMSGLAIAVFVYALMGRRNNDKLKNPIKNLEPVSDL